MADNNNHKNININKSNNVETNQNSNDNKKNIGKNIRSRISYYAKNSSSLFGLIIIILISVCTIRFLYYGSTDGVSLRSFLDTLNSAPQVSNYVKNFVQLLQIGGSWGVFDFLRTIFNFFLEYYSIIVWAASSLIDVVIFICYFLSWLFL